MGSKAAKSTDTVHLYPVPGAAGVDGVPHVEQDVTAERAEELLARGGPFNPQFTTEKLDIVQVQQRIRAALEAAEAETAEPLVPTEPTTEEPEPTPA